MGLGDIYYLVILHLKLLITIITVSNYTLNYTVYNDTVHFIFFERIYFKSHEKASFEHYSHIPKLSQFPLHPPERNANPDERHQLRPLFRRMFGETHFSERFPGEYLYCGVQEVQSYVHHSQHLTVN